MNEVKLNMIYAAYIKGEVEFNEVYQATKRIRDINECKVRGIANCDENDATELFDDTFMKLTLGPEVPDFERALNVRLKRRRIDLLRRMEKRKPIESYDEILDSADEEGTAIPDSFRSSHNLEREVLMKEADHRQVIDSLVRDGNPDATTTAIVEAFKTALPSASDNAIARELGLHHQQVKRKLRALSRYYDANRFGDYRDYLSA